MILPRGGIIVAGMRRALFPVVVLVCLTAGCGQNTPPSPSPPSGGVETITGRERLGWDQPAADAAELATFRYAIYVDGARSEIADTSCGPSAGTAGFACSGRLPALAAGTHILELATFPAGTDAESARSGPLSVTVSALTAGAVAPWEGGQIETSAGRLRLARLAGDLDRPIDGALAPDGRLLIVERSGRVRVFAGGGEVQASELSVDAADGRVSDPVVSIAIDPDFSRTRFVFAVQTPASADASVFSVARFRELGGILAQRAVIFETRVTGPVRPGGRAAVIRFGPDGKLYVALGNGRLLRLNPDGTMPRDQAGTTPAIAAGIQSPRGLAWHPGSGILWVVDEDVVDEDVADDDVSGTGHLSGVVVDGNPLRAAVRARHDLKDGARSLAFSGSDAFIASPRGQYLLRVRFSADDPTRIADTERWLEDGVGAVRVVFTGTDGALYFCTNDALGKLTPLR